jgi:hypothetical protein
LNVEDLYLFPNLSGHEKKRLEVAGNVLKVCSVESSDGLLYWLTMAPSIGENE